MARVEISEDLIQSREGLKKHAFILKSGPQLIWEEIIVESEYPEKFVDSLRQMELNDNLEAMLDFLYVNIDNLLLAGKFATVDDILEVVQPPSVGIHTLLGLLTVTLPAKPLLEARKGFYEACETYLRNTPVWEENLLSGLE